MLQQYRLYVFKFTTGGPSNLMKNMLLGDWPCDVLTEFRHIALCCRRPTIFLSTAFKGHSWYASMLQQYRLWAFKFTTGGPSNLTKNMLFGDWPCDVLTVSPYCTMLQTAYNIPRYGVQKGTPDTLPCCSNIVCVCLNLRPVGLRIWRKICFSATGHVTC